VLINSTLNGASACFVAYNRPANLLYLINDAGSGLVAGFITPGTPGSLSNSQCTLSSAGTATAAGNTLTVPIAVTFQTPAFSGVKTIYLLAVDTGGANSGWQSRGTWTVP